MSISKSTLLNVPGYTNYLYGDEIPISSELKQQCDQIMYENFMQINVAYYKPSFARFVEHVLHTKPLKFVHVHDFPSGYPNDRRVAELRYYYNRQLIFQMCNIPKKNEDKEHVTMPSVPIYRSHEDMEIQMDVMYFASSFTKDRVVNHFLIATDPYTRYAWASEINTTDERKLEVSRVNAAITRAFERGKKAEFSASYKYFQFIREKVKYIRVDQGSEFKKEFPTNMKALFPNATIRTSTPKKDTFQSSNSTGPVESLIRMLRRVIRDESLGAIDHQPFLQDDHLELVLEKYNNLKQLHTLQNFSPQEMATILEKNKTEYIEFQDDQNDLIRQIKSREKQHFQQMQVQKYPNTDNLGFRLYLDPGVFPKETDVRVSLNVYRILRQRPENVDLEEIPPQWRQHDPKQIKLNIRWELLVAVKLPVEDGPNASYGNYVRSHFAIRRLPDGSKDLGVANPQDSIIVYLPSSLGVQNPERLPETEYYDRREKGKANSKRKANHLPSQEQKQDPGVMTRSRARRQQQVQEDA